MYEKLPYSPAVHIDTKVDKLNHGPGWYDQFWSVPQQYSKSLCSSINTFCCRIISNPFLIDLSLEGLLIDSFHSINISPTPCEDQLCSVRALHKIQHARKRENLKLWMRAATFYQPSLDTSISCLRCEAFSITPLQCFFTKIKLLLLLISVLSCSCPALFSI